MNQINIMHLVTTRAEELYGGDTVILSLLRNLNKTRFNSVVVCFLDKKSKGIPLLLKVVKEMGIITDTVYLKSRFDIFAVFKIRKLLKKYQIDILHCHEYKSNILGLLATFLSRVKKVTTIHGWLGFLEIKGNFEPKIYEYIDALVRRKYDRVVGVSRGLCGLLIKKGCFPYKVRLIYNGIDLEKNQTAISDKIREKLGINHSLKVIGNIGRLSEEKGHKYLLEAAAQVVKVFPDTIFIIVGDGPLKDKLLKLTSTLNIENKVIFTGYRKNIVNYLSIMDIFVSASLWEGFGLSLIEAMALGKPVIATNVGVVPEIIDNGVNGVLVNTKNSSELSDAVINLLSDEKTSVLMGKAAEKAVRDKFSAKEMARKYEGLYYEIDGKFDEKMNLAPITEKEIIKYYEEYHDEKNAHNPPPKFYRQFLHYLKFKNGDKILDVGCGRGQMLKEAENLGLLSYGVDISEKGLGFAKRISPKSKIVCCNADRLPFKNNTFDHAIMLGTLEHFLDPANALKEAKRILIPDGNFCIVVPNLYYIRDIGNIWKKKKIPSTSQIFEVSKSFCGWKKFFKDNGLKVNNVFKDNHILYYIGLKNSLAKKIIKIVIRPFLFLLPLNLSFQFVFICTKYDKK